MHSLTLRDGRTLAYQWFGTQRSPPQPPAAPATEAAVPPPASAAATASGSAPRVLLHFHGFLSSRLEGALLHEHALHHGLSILAIDRPGAGGSTLNPRQVGMYMQQNE